MAPNKVKVSARANMGRRASVAIVEQLTAIEASGGEGTLNFGHGKSLHVSSLDKEYFPADGYTKGDLMRYYAGMEAAILPVIKDRPLVLKRYPDGIDGPSFFQQNTGAHLPDDVRSERVAAVDRGKPDRIVGGDLLTLLYTVQIGTIAVHSWQTRVQDMDSADSATIDLDPGDDVSFREVVALAREIGAVLDSWQLRSSIKTSGSSGVHIVLPLPAKTTFDEAAQLATTVAERIVEAHPDRATTERAIKSRPAGTIYVDALQNAKGKSVVAAYSVRERKGATVSAPLEWRELRPSLRLESFTIKTEPARLKRIGDLWSVAMKRRNTRRVVDRVLRGA